MTQNEELTLSIHPCLAQEGKQQRVLVLDVEELEWDLRELLMVPVDAICCYGISNVHVGIIFQTTLGSLT